MLTSPVNGSLTMLLTDDDTTTKESAPQRALSKGHAWGQVCSKSTGFSPGCPQAGPPRLRSVKVSTDRIAGRAAPSGHAGILAEMTSLESAIEAADDDERRRLEASLDVLASYELALAACEDAGVSTTRMSELARRASSEAAHAYAWMAYRQRSHATAASG
jgi:hypothetical protein